MSYLNLTDAAHRTLVERAVHSSWFNLNPIMSNVESVLKRNALGIIDYSELLRFTQDVVVRANKGEL